MSYKNIKKGDKMNENDLKMFERIVDGIDKRQDDVDKIIQAMVEHIDRQDQVIEFLRKKVESFEKRMDFDDCR